MTIPRIIDEIAPAGRPPNQALHLTAAACRLLTVQAPRAAAAAELVVRRLPMSTSVTTAAIKSVSETCIVSLKPHGFRRKSPHLYSETNDVFHCVHFQSSQWGSRESGRFTVNLAVTSPAIYRRWTGRRFPSNPATALWPIQQRIGTACGEARDLWWDVSADSDVSGIAADVCQRLVRCALPFFTRYPSTAAILADVQSGVAPPSITMPQLPLLHAILLADAGHHSEAAECIERAIAQHKGTPFCETIVMIARRLNVSVPGANIAEPLYGLDRLNKKNDSGPDVD
jgi:Domain of unknown function (DUF4304)